VLLGSSPQTLSIRAGANGGGVLAWSTGNHAGEGGRRAAEPERTLPPLPMGAESELRSALLAMVEQPMARADCPRFAAYPSMALLRATA